eukprot:gene19577-biopygen22051
MRTISPGVGHMLRRCLPILIRCAMGGEMYPGRAKGAISRTGPVLRGPSNGDPTALIAALFFVWQGSLPHYSGAGGSLPQRRRIISGSAHPCAAAFRHTVPHNCAADNACRTVGCTSLCLGAVPRARACPRRARIAAASPTRRGRNGAAPGPRPLSFPPNRSPQRPGRPPPAPKEPRARFHWRPSQ